MDAHEKIVLISVCKPRERMYQTMKIGTIADFISGLTSKWQRKQKYDDKHQLRLVVGQHTRNDIVV